MSEWYEGKTHRGRPVPRPVEQGKKREPKEPVRHDSRPPKLPLNQQPIMWLSPFYVARRDWRWTGRGMDASQRTTAQR
jgi:hypothetical protein